MSPPADPRRSSSESQAASSQPADSEEKLASSPSAEEPQLLDQVMSQTLANLTSSRELDPQVLAALQQVAQRYPDEGLSLDPVAIELIAASLHVQFPLLAQREAMLRRMSLWVAESILDDPAARHRLAELWARLGEARP